MTKYLHLLTFLISTFLLACSSDSGEEDPIESDKTPPTIQLSFAGIPSVSPDSPIVVSKQIQISIAAQDANGISKVEAFIDSEKVGEDLTTPYQFTIDVSGYASKSAKGIYNDYVLKIVATDIAGNTASQEQIINVDNELPAISEVSLLSDSVLQGDTNPLTFQVADNKDIASVTLFLNGQVYAELAVEGPFEANLNTSTLPDGPNTLKIEATDLADNKAVFEVAFISDNLGPEVTFSNLTDGMVIDANIILSPVVTDAYSEVASVEIKYNDLSLAVVESGAPIQFDFDPEGFGVGVGSFEITAVDGVGNTSTTTLSAEINRRLIEINIPENWLSPYITAAVVFISRMDGSNVVWDEILPQDRQIILSVPEEFDMSTEFMLTFYWQDNGGIATLSTHQNLTRGTPGVLNLAVPVRRDGNGSGTQVPIANFLSNDVIIGESATSYSFLQSVDAAPSSYTVYIDTAQDFLNISIAEDPLYSNPFDQVYVYDLNSYSNLLIPNPVPANYVLDKANMTTANLETRQLVVSSPVALSNTSSVLRITGALSQEDDTANKFHEMFVWNRVGSLDTPMNYQLNTTFSSYRHALHFGNYYTERKGSPMTSYTIPDVAVDYVISNNQIALTVQGTEHIVGRAQCYDFANQTYAWNLTFDSQIAGPVVIPELPISISHPVKATREADNIKVEKVELVSFASIPTYSQYINDVVKNQTNIIESTDWYELVFKSRTGSFNVPIRDFLFQ